MLYLKIDVCVVACDNEMCRKIWPLSERQLFLSFSVCEMSRAILWVMMSCVLLWKEARDEDICICVGRVEFALKMVDCFDVVSWAEDI